MAKSVTKRQSTEPATWLDDQSEKFAGAGTSQAPDDNLIPLVRRLQALSPQAKKRAAEYVQGAEPGDIFFKDEVDPIVKGEDGFLFQPCAFGRDYVEWRPLEQGGGYVGRWPLRGANEPDCPDAVARTDPANGRTSWFRSNGNELIDTRYHVGFVIRDGAAAPYVIPMKSTDHTVSRGWMRMMNSHLTSSGNVMPSWAHIYRLTTVEKSNAIGSWYTWRIAQEGPITSKEEFDRGVALNKAWSSQEVTAAVEEDVHDVVEKDDDAF